MESNCFSDDGLNSGVIPFNITTELDEMLESNLSLSVIQRRDTQRNLRLQGQAIKTAAPSFAIGSRPLGRQTYPLQTML